MSDPINHLLDEHREILAGLEGLRGAVRALEGRGDEAVAELRPVLEAASRLLTTRLLHHARKEDEALFPQVEAVLGVGGGPTAVMRQEHRWIKGHAMQFRAVLAELHEVEHPAVAARTAELRELTERNASAAELHAVGTEVLQLLDLHFGKEEDILFPMAREILDPGALEAAMRKMEELDALDALDAP